MTQQDFQREAEQTRYALRSSFLSGQSYEKTRTQRDF